MGNVDLDDLEFGIFPTDLITGVICTVSAPKALIFILILLLFSQNMCMFSRENAIY